MVGLDVTHKSTMSAAELDGLRAAGGKHSEYVWSICQFYKARERAGRVGGA